MALKTTGTQTITATDASNNTINGGVGVNVVAAAVKDLVITTSFASSDVAGTVGTVTITAFDAYNNPVASGPNEYKGTVNLSDTDSLATGLPSSYPFTTGDAGSHTFNSVVLKTAGSQSITATDSVHGTLTATATVDVVPAVVNDFVVTTSFANPEVAGTVGSVTITAKDAYGNTVGSGPNLYRGTVDLNSHGRSGGGPPSQPRVRDGRCRSVHVYRGGAQNGREPDRSPRPIRSTAPVTGGDQINVVAAAVAEPAYHDQFRLDQRGGHRGHGDDHRV